MRDLSVKIINLRRTYEIGMGNVLKVINKEFHRVLDEKGKFTLPQRYVLKRNAPYEIISIWTDAEDVYLTASAGSDGGIIKLSDLHMDDQADLYTYLIPILR